MNGIINIYKERGYTSHDVVARARGILQIKKIGHTGTLDPEATGVLPICIGRATKASETLLEADKTYIATVSLGSTTTTQDAEGKVISTKSVNSTKEDITSVVNSFLGEYMQVPPMYSAIKVNGKKLYEIARQGKTIKRNPRQVYIYSANIIKFISTTEFQLKVKCSKGTYIRTLCYDIGQKLGCGAHLKTLTRTKVDDFEIENSITLGHLETLMDTNEIKSVLINIDTLYKDLPIMNVDPSYNKFLYNGNQLDKKAILNHNNINIHKRVRIYDDKNNFIGVYQVKKNKDKIFYTPEKIFYI